MIRNNQFLQKFYDRHHKNEGPLPFLHALKLFTAMWRQGVSLGVLPPEDPMEGIEIDIKIARVLNSCSKSSCPK